MICTMGRDASIHDTICPVAVMSGFGPLVLPFGGIIAETLDISTHRILILHSCSPQELAGATGMRLDSQPSGLLISDALSALIGPVARLVAVVTGSWLLLASCGSRPRPAILATAFLATTFGSFVLALPFFLSFPFALFFTILAVILSFALWLAFIRLVCTKSSKTFCVRGLPCESSKHEVAHHRKPIRAQAAPKSSKIHATTSTSCNHREGASKCN